MTTYVNFVPTDTVNFQFSAILDGKTYAVICPWNLFGQRWYVNVYDLNGNLIVSTPQVGSTAYYDVNLVAGFFKASTLIWRVANNQFEISP